MRLGWVEIVIILALVVLVVKARRLPELGRSLGQAIREFRHALQSSSRRKDQDTSDQRKDPS